MSSPGQHHGANCNPPRFHSESECEDVNHWSLIDEDRADYYLGVLPPIYFRGGFFVSEPITHEGGFPVYTAVVQRGEKWYARDVAVNKIGDALRELDMLEEAP